MAVPEEVIELVEEAEGQKVRQRRLICALLSIGGKESAFSVESEGIMPSPSFK